ncbi:MAG TPA: D-alanyl-D-alanine carboxypeptidase family protein [Blastocatellia bacterium]|nr:D-alanyl-D-alanine carboxypeptidase family protein [Blastocatellia bacterium]
MRSLLVGLWVAAFLTASTTGYAFGQSRRAATARNKAHLSKTNKRGPQRAATKSRRAQGCGQCAAQISVRNKSKAAKRGAQTAACHPRGYVDPAIARNYHNAMRDLRRAGIEPKVTSTWRSSAHQAKLHRCSNSRRCRRAHPGLYYAKPPGESLHEAGFAVDMSGVAIGPRGAKRLTPRGRRIVAIMRKSGFSWRYGLADPAHFEIDPRKHGYRTAQQAIRRSQSQCQARYIARAGRANDSGSRRIVARNR